MKREIKFRGKSVDEGKWLIGSLVPNGQRPCIAPFKEGFHLERVDPSTVGQFTGLTDYNGKEIYEGDIIHLNEEEFELEYGNGIVVFLDKDFGGRPCGGMWYVEDADKNSRTDNSLYDLYQCGSLEIIGNIHDNSEMLK